MAYSNVRSSVRAAEVNDDPRLELPPITKDLSGLVVNEYHHHEARGVVRYFPRSTRI